MEDLSTAVRIDELPPLQAIKTKIEDPPNDVEILAGPRQFNEKDELPEEYRELLIHLIYNHAENIDSQPYCDMIESQWQLAREQAPTKLDLMMMARFHYEELNHGHIFAKLLRGLAPDIEKYELRQYLFEHPRRSWLELAIHHYLASKVGVLQESEWQESSYAPLAQVSPKVLREERGHAGMGLRHLREALQRDSENYDRANELLVEWWPMSLDMFGRSDSTRNRRYRAWGLKKHTNEQLRTAFIADTRPQLQALGLTVPDDVSNRRYM